MGGTGRILTLGGRIEPRFKHEDFCVGITREGGDAQRWQAADGADAEE